jgi:hypothetical protein
MICRGGSHAIFSSLPCRTEKASKKEKGFSVRFSAKLGYTVPMAHNPETLAMLARQSEAFARMVEPTRPEVIAEHRKRTILARKALGWKGRKESISRMYAGIAADLEKNTHTYHGD